MYKNYNFLFPLSLKILRGIIVAAGQVYGVEDEIGGILIYIGILIYSPILFMMSVFGAILGTICGMSANGFILQYASQL